MVRHCNVSFMFIYCSSIYYFFYVRRGINLQFMYLGASALHIAKQMRLKIYLYIVVRVCGMNPRESAAWDDPPTKESSTDHVFSPLSANASSANCSRFSRSGSDPSCTDRRNCDRVAPRLNESANVEGLRFPWTGFPAQTGGSSFSPEAPYRPWNHSCAEIELLDLRSGIRDCTYPPLL